MLDQMPSQWVLRSLYRLLFDREPELSAEAPYLRELESGELTARQLVEWLIHSAEWSHVIPMTEFGPSLHYGRGVFIRSLPRARRILDLGGASIGDPSGALVLMGYPYDFEELVVVDLPTEDRHELYREEARHTKVLTKRGPVRYEYHSMADLSRYASKSFDMIYSGQSIEHISLLDAQRMLSQARRVLSPGGHLVVDTPNARLTKSATGRVHRSRSQVRILDRELSTLLRSRGFAIHRATGISYGGRSVEPSLRSGRDRHHAGPVRLNRRLLSPRVRVSSLDHPCTLVSYCTTQVASSWSLGYSNSGMATSTTTIPRAD